jgi:hypothetical protein
MRDWPALRNTEWLERTLDSRAYTQQWTDIFERTYSGNVDTWDYQWVYSCFVSSMLSVVPNDNLIQNIGFGIAATHTTGFDSPLAKTALIGTDFPLRHPATVAPDTRAQSLIMNAQVGPAAQGGGRRLARRAYRKALRVMRSIASHVGGK